MPSAQQVRELIPDTIDLAREHAEDLVSAGSKAVKQTAGEVSDRVGNVDVESLVEGAKTHRLRSALIGLVILAILGLVIKKATSKPPYPDEPYRT